MNARQLRARAINARAREERVNQSYVEVNGAPPVEWKSIGKRPPPFRGIEGVVSVTRVFLT